MKISMFHPMPYRDLPADFEQRYHSVWVDPPWWELADVQKVHQYYNWTLDEFTYAAKAGLDGICVNEHHQNAYGFMPGPNLMGAILARATNGLDVAIVQMGSTLPTTIPPIHGALGLTWDAFLETLAQYQAVYAPEHPRTTPGDPDAIKSLDDVWDRVLYYDELLDWLELEVPVVVGYPSLEVLAGWC